METATTATNVTTTNSGAVPIETKPNAQATETKVAQPAFDPKTHKEKLKIDGKEIEMTLDEMKALVQLRKVSDEKMMTATAKERRAQEFIEKLQKDPKSILRAKDLGLTHEQLKKLGEELLSEQLDEELMDPKDKELRDLRRQLDETKAEKQAREHAESEAQKVALQKRYADEYTKEIMEVVEKSTLPTTPYMVSRVARYMGASLDSEKPLTAQECVPLVKEDYKADLSHFLKDLSAAQIIEFLGDDVGKKIREFDLAKLKSPQDNLKKPEKQASKDNDTVHRPKTGKITATEWRKKMTRD